MDNLHRFIWKLLYLSRKHPIMSVYSTTYAAGAEAAQNIGQWIENGG